jgi:hypothetical protein
MKEETIDKIFFHGPIFAIPTIVLIAFFLFTPESGEVGECALNERQEWESLRSQWLELSQQQIEITRLMDDIEYDVAACERYLGAKPYCEHITASDERRIRDHNLDCAGILKRWKDWG